MLRVRRACILRTSRRWRPVTVNGAIYSPCRRVHARVHGLGGRGSAEQLRFPFLLRTTGAIGRKYLKFPTREISPRRTLARYIDPYRAMREYLRDIPFTKDPSSAGHAPKREPIWRRTLAIG